jgi:hypothetical protein
MALAYKVGNFAQPTANNASFGVTGVGFKPKAVIFYATDETGLGVSVNWNWYQGMATATNNRAACSNAQLTASSTSCRAHDNTKCFEVVNTSGTIIVAADLVSFDSDGFTLNFSTTDLSARVVGYVAIGGADLTNAFIKEFTPTINSNTAQGFTGVGFKPTAMFMISAGSNTGPPGADTSNCNPMFSFASSASNQEVLSANPQLQTRSAQLAKIIEKDGSMVGSLTSFDSDGFTITFTASSSVKHCYALCLKGGQYSVGVFNQATSNGNQANTAVGFQTVGVIWASFNAVTSAVALTTQSRLSFGAASGTSNRMSIWSGGGNAGVQDNDTDTSKILNMITEGATPTTNTAADFVSFDSQGFTINNTTTDATAREIVYMAFGSNASANNLLLMGAGT